MLKQMSTTTNKINSQKKTLPPATKRARSTNFIMSVSPRFAVSFRRTIYTYVYLLMLCNLQNQDKVPGNYLSEILTLGGATWPSKRPESKKNIRPRPKTCLLNKSMEWRVFSFYHQELKKHTKSLIPYQMWHSLLQFPLQKELPHTDGLPMLINWIYCFCNVLCIRMLYYIRR